MMRFLLILMLVWQPLSLRAGAASPMTPMTPMTGSMHAATGCCEIVEVVSCCEPQPQPEPRCEMTGGACQCSTDPAIPLDREPAIPSSDTAPRCLASAAYEVVTFATTQGDEPPAVRGLRGRPTCSHNTQQALIGIWRT